MNIKKYNWKVAEPYFDVQLKQSSRGRKREFITLKRFKELVLSGITMRNMHQFTSKNLAMFYSNFCQGKITLTKEKFQEEYNSGKSLEQIAKENHISKDYIGFLRQLYQIKAKGAKFIHRKNTEEPLAQRQREIIYGSLMGDGKKCAYNSVGFNHSDKQKDYLYWKYNELKNLATKRGVKKETYFDKRYSKTYISYRFYTNANTELEEINNKFYGEGHKEVTQDTLDELTPLSIAVWYMDDGTGAFNTHNMKKHPDWNISPEIRFCTDSFSKESCENIVKWFKVKWDINCHLRMNKIGKNGEPQYRIIIDSTSINDFIDIIRPHIIDSMLYKIGEKQKGIKQTT